MLNPKYKTIIKVAETGGRVLDKYFAESLLAENKETVIELRAKADGEVESIILAMLLEEFPDYNILAEEGGFLDRKSEFTLIIDSLDGANNFILGIPYFAVAIALLQNDKIIFSVVHQPVIQQTYYAEKDKGAWLNNQKIKINKSEKLDKIILAYNCGYHLSDSEYSNDVLKKIQYSIKARRVLSTWCPALDFCLLASGKIDVVINNDNEVYDYIAGKFIVQEAGAIITDFFGNDQYDRDSSFVVSNNKNIHQQVLGVL